MQKKQIALLSIAVVAVVGIIGGLTYALWSSTSTQTGDNVITTGCFEITFTESAGSDIDLQSAFPITDSDGMNTTPYEFTIENTCDLPAGFAINFEVAADSTLSVDYLKATLNTNTPQVLSDYASTTATMEGRSAYQLLTGKLNGGASATYAFRMWLDEDAPQSDAQSKSLSGKIVVSATPNSTGNNVTEIVLVDGEQVMEYPGNWATFNGVTCTNGATATWDEESWSLKTTTTTDTECTLSFNGNAQVAATYINSLQPTNTDTMNNDDPDSNVRYMGADPKNYVTFNDELWRIIGVFDVASTEGGQTEERVKLIRTDRLGWYAWDTSDASVNAGTGVNEWSQADIMTTLNSGVYWNRTSGTCYSSAGNYTVNCDFSSIGLTSDAKTLIGDAYWHLGTVNGTTNTVRNSITLTWYEGERSTNVGKTCSSGTYCNDTVTRTTGWVGQVGLMYPSDYGYSTSGGTTTDRATCLSTVLFNWKGSDVSDCKNNSWLFNNSSIWMITAAPDSANAVLGINSNSLVEVGYLTESYASYQWSVHPVVYLDANVKINGGDGSSGNPYTLEI